MNEEVEVHHLIYLSKAAPELTAGALLSIESRAQAKNESAAITGLLAYGSGHFLQVLEGPEIEVERVYSNIEQDARHTDLQVLTFEAVQTRAFAPWAMALVNLDCDASKVADASLRTFPSAIGPFPADARLAFAMLYALQAMLVERKKRTGL